MKTEERIQLLLKYSSADWRIGMLGLSTAYERACKHLDETVKADKDARKAAFRTRQDAWDAVRDKVTEQLAFLQVDVHPDEISMIAQALVRRLQ